MAIPNLMLSMRLAALFSLITCAQLAQSAGLLRDSDIEAGLSRIAAPVLIAAGLSPVSTKVLVVDDDRLNAFVIDRHHIFLHSHQDTWSPKLEEEEVEKIAKTLKKTKEHS